MQLVKLNGYYVFECEIHERQICQQHGFRWTALVPNRWATDSPRIALNLAAYADDDLRAELLFASIKEPDPFVPRLIMIDGHYVLETPKVRGQEFGMLAKAQGFKGHGPPEWKWTSQDPQAALALFNAVNEKAKALRVGFYCPDELKDALIGKLTSQAASIVASRASDAEIDLPCPPGLEYMGFQRAGIQYAINPNRATPHVLFGDEMGLGKTIEAIGVINATPETKAVCVICPASLKVNWLREMQRWLVPQLSIGIASSQFMPRTDVVIINYESLSRVVDVDPLPADKCKTCKISRKTHELRGCKTFKETIKRELRPRLAATEWDVLIVDESHRIKTKKAQRTEFTLGIKAKRKLFLTGTPIPNRVKELWTTIQALDPTGWGSEWQFLKRYCYAGMQFGHPNYSGAQNLEELSDRLRATIMVRRLKSEVLTELPPKRRQIIELPAANEAMKQLSLTSMQKYVDSERQRESLRVRVELSKASDDPEDYKRAVAALKADLAASFDELSRIRHETAVAKIPMVIDHLKNVIEETGKVIFFAHHKDVLQAVAKEFGSAAVLLYGDTPMGDRMKHVDRFQSDPSCKLFVGGLLAAGVGLTLTASSLVVFGELDWVPGNVTQGEDRAHRVGQTDSVLVQHLVLEDSLDAYMAGILVQKQEIADRALDTKSEAQEIEVFDADLPEIEGFVPVLPKKQEASAPKWSPQQVATSGYTPEAVTREAATLSPDRILEIHAALRRLAQVCDGAEAQDGVGYNGMDTRLGHDLASKGQLTPKQAALGKALLKKYKNTQFGRSIDHFWK